MDVGSWPKYTDRKSKTSQEMTGPPDNFNVKLLQKEIVTHAQLEHENIIPLLGVYRETDDGPPMMILPYLENGSAPDYLETLSAPNVTVAIIRIVREVTVDWDSSDSLVYRYVTWCVR